jgi:hypothetical protein
MADEAGAATSAASQENLPSAKVVKPKASDSTVHASMALLRYANGKTDLDPRAAPVRSRRRPSRSKESSYGP